MVILGIDPGYAIVGWGVLSYQANRFTPLAYGAITTPAGMPFAQRLQCIYTELEAIFEKYRPEAMAVEELFFTHNQTTGIAVAEARGVVLLCAARHGVEIAEYTPMQVKQAVVGYGKAVKNQVMEMTRVLLKLEKLPRPDDTADALAVAICHAHSAGSALSRRLAALR